MFIDELHTLVGAGGAEGAIDASNVHADIDGRQKGYASTRCGQVHYWTFGTGPVLLAVHQSAQASNEYIEFAACIGDDFRVLAIDLPGHGASDDPDHELGVDEYADVVVDVLDALGLERVHALGHHGGAYIALNLADRYPDRVDRTVFSGEGRLSPSERDAILNTPMSRDLPLDEAGEFLLRTWRVYQKMSAPGTTLPVTYNPFLVSLDGRTRPYDMHFSVLRWDAEVALARHRKPTLLLRGEHDIYSGDVEAVHELVADSRLEVIDGGGAWLFYEQPEACARLVREFLLSQPG